MLGKVAGGHYCVRMTMKERNPQAEQMGDESMLRNLAAQAEAIWPQEQRLFDRYQLPGTAHIADIGCGSGEITSRLAALYPEAELIGVDILEASVAYARRRYASLAPRVRFEQGDAFELKLGTGEFDWNGHLYLGKHQPLVTRELWERVQGVLDGRHAKKNRRVKHDFAFSGLISCGHCGCSIVCVRVSFSASSARISSAGSTTTFTSKSPV